MSVGNLNGLCQFHGSPLIKGGHKIKYCCGFLINTALQFIFRRFVRISDFHLYRSACPECRIVGIPLCPHYDNFVFHAFRTGKPCIFVPAALRHTHTGCQQEPACRAIGNIGTLIARHPCQFLSQIPLKLLHIHKAAGNFPHSFQCIFSHTAAAVYRIGIMCVDKGRNAAFF
ncbi:hypothetical protein IMSAG249_01739 [Lachnospiraceae bacterium]|nr:hypothetical protein IMSAG249_01739 [Lachnospiraceae bacterium]